MAKASGQLRVLNVSGREVAAPTLLDALAANAASLELLGSNPTTWYTSAELVGVLDAAPLCVCHLSTRPDNVEQARRYVRNEPPYDRLRLHGLYVGGEGELQSPESLEALCADLIKHPSLANFAIENASLGTAAAMRVFVNAAITLRVKVICLFFCAPACPS